MKCCPSSIVSLGLWLLLGFRLVTGLCTAVHAGMGVACLQAQVLEAGPQCDAVGVQQEENRSWGL